MSDKKETLTAVTNQADIPEWKSDVKYQKIEEFTEEYANSSQFQPSIWDMKIIFGQTDMSMGPDAILQHTAITIPWSQVKMMIYFLTVNLCFHESKFGRVVLAEGLIPEIPKEMPKPFKDIGTSEETWKAVREMYEDFLARNPEATPLKKR